MIVGIKPGGIGKVDVTSVGSGTEKRHLKEQSGTFADLMNLAATDIAAKPDTENPIKQSKVDKTDKSDSENDTDIYESTVNKQNSKPEDKQNVQEKKNDAGQAESPKTENAVSKDNEKMLAEELKKQLGLDEESLQNLMETFGVTMQQLMNPDILSQFALQVNGATTVDLLINEDLRQTLQDLLQSLQTILDDHASDYTTEELKQEIPEILDGEDIPKDEFAQGGLSNAFKQRETDANVDNLRQNVSKTAFVDENGSKDKNSEQTVSDVHVTVQTEAMSDSDKGQFLDMGEHDQMANQIVQNLNQAWNQIDNIPLENGFDQSISQTDIIRQVVDQIKLNLSKDVTSLTVQLNPEQLGKVQIHVATKNGVMQAQIIAENEAAKNAVESGLSILKEAFDSQDLKVDAIEVMVGTQDYFAQSEGEEQSDAKEKKSGNKVQAINRTMESDDDISEEQKLEAEMMKVQGNQVSYTV